MKTFSTRFISKSYAYALFFLFSLMAMEAGSQCLITAANNCPATTDPFNTNTFTDLQHVTHANGAYQASGNVASFSITSNKHQVVGNVILVGLQITEGAERIQHGIVEILEDGKVICSYRSGIQAGSFCLSVSALNGKVVQFRFTFNRKDNGNIKLDNFGIDPALAVLPVKFTAFEARPTFNGVQLSWKVADEVNVKGYAIESSTNGTLFHKIGFVTATDVNTYTFRDAQPGGNMYYRIKNIDYDGRYSYSNVIAINKNISATVLKVFPTPANNIITVQHDVAQNATITINAQDGKWMKTVKPANGALQTAVDMYGLPAGIYMLQWNNTNRQPAYLKIVKQ